MNIAKYAVSRPVAVTMQIAALVLLGAISLTRLPVDLLPKVTIPTVNVSTQWPNVAPEEIEAQITRPVEQALSSVPGLYTITSTTSAGSSNVRVQFVWGTDIGQASIDVMQRIERAKRSFPNDDTLQTPTVSKFDPNQISILNIGVTGENDPVKLRTLMDNQVSPIIESADGVAAATINGGINRAIIVNVDPLKLRAHNIVLADIMRRLLQENINAPAGIARQSDTEYTIRSQGWLTSIDDIKKITLSAANGNIVTINDVADVNDSNIERRVYTRLNGKPAVNISITKQSDANTITTVKSVMERIERVKKIYPNLNFETVYDQSKYVQRSVDDLMVNAIIGSVLAILILLFFLRNIRSTLVVALSIPISIISTFTLLYLCGFTLNTMSLSGLALATGLIVDDAVVVLENIFRHIERDKKTVIEAAVSGTNEIMSAVIASTWTVMVVFLPLLLIKGQSGQMFSQFALVVIFSLMISLLVAVTIVPMLATKLVSGDAHMEQLLHGHKSEKWHHRMFFQFGLLFDKLDESYRSGLKWALRFRWQTLVGAFTITILAFLLKPLLGTEAIPPTDTGDLSINIKLPPGTALEKTDTVMKKIEKIVGENENVAVAFATSGAGGRGGGASSGNMNIHLKEDRKQSTKDVMADLRKKLSTIPGVRPSIRSNDIVSSLMTGGDQNIEIDIFGSDLGTLSRLSQDVMRQVKTVSNLENVDVNWQEAMPEVQWTVDRSKASLLGVTFRDISDTLSTATNGSVASYFQDKGFQYPIVVQLPQSERKTVDKMANIIVTPSGAGATKQGIVLRQVANPVYANGPNQITRQDRQRYIAISGSPIGRSSGDVQKDVQEVMSKIQLPTGYYWDWGINQKRQAQESGGMNFAIILAIGIIFMLLAAQFESYSQPFAILLSVPLAATGVIVGLFITNQSLGLTAQIGILMLVGIVVKNGILLVDYTNTLRKKGMERNEAILTASPTRLRPILMTAFAAMLGMLPLATGIGEGSEIQQPMAIAVIGGLITSTFLTLFVVPVVYTYLDDILVKRLKKKQHKQRIEATEE
jgi:HAE1 family hydrophobic/amphiphilic exporter-1